MKEEIEKALAQANLGNVIVLNPFKSISNRKDPRATTLTFGDTRRRCLPTLPGQLAELGGPATYLNFGKSLVKETKEWAGTCAEFACASIAAIKALKLATGVGVELFSFGKAHSGHVFVVVNRASSSDVAEPASWGQDCLVVDQWYANQQDPVEGPVKTANDTVYWTWLTNNKPTNLHHAF